MLLSLFILAQSIEGPIEPTSVGINIGIVEISAVVGALLILARIIVKFTKNKKDDAVVEKVAGWLKVLRVVTGLNIKKGTDKYGKE